MTAYIYDIETVSVQYVYVCVVLVHHCAKNAYHNSPLDRRTDVHGPVFYLADLDICAVSLVPILTVSVTVGRPATKFHVLYLSTDCIPPIVHRNYWMVPKRAPLVAAEVPHYCTVPVSVLNYSWSVVPNANTNRVPFDLWCTMCRMVVGLIGRFVVGSRRIGD